MFRMLCLFWLCCLVLPQSGCESRETAAPEAEAFGSILVFTAASTLDAMEAAAREFTEATGVEVRLNPAGSSTLAQQILAGAEADLFLSANQDWVNRVEQADLVARRRDLLANALVVVTPADAAAGLNDPGELRHPAIERIAMADPASVPAGMYGRRALEQLGFWEELKPKVVATSDVRQALAYVERGEADAGIVYATDAAISADVRIAAWFEERFTGPIRYPLALLRTGEANPAAEQFFEFLCAKERAPLYRHFGFTLPEPFVALEEAS